jgi:hypothetical protein
MWAFWIGAIRIILGLDLIAGRYFFLSRTYTGVLEISPDFLIVLCYNIFYMTLIIGDLA